MTDFFQKDVRTINEHIQNVFSEGELTEKAVIRKFRIAQSEGPRDTARDVEHSFQRLLTDFRGMIESTRQQVAQAVNAGLTMLCWSVGRRIREDILNAKRAEYGERIVSTLSRLLDRKAP